MFDFKKGKASDKVLSEQEIQQKLYGRFLTNKNSVAGASESYTRPTAPKASATSSSSAAVLFPEETTEELNRADSLQQELISEVRAPEKKNERKDFTSLPNKEALRERFQNTENDLLKASRNKSSASKVSFQRVIPKLDLPKIPFQSIFSAVSNAAAVFFNAVFGFFFMIGRVVDFRKEGVRTGLAWGSGVVMLVLLLAAIQGLNSKREIAMKTSVPKAPKKISAKANVQKALVPALPVLDGQNADTDVADRNAKPLTPVQDKKETPKKAAAASKGRFVIQVATYVIRDDANRLLGDLQKIEPKSFVKGLSRSSGKTYYSVFLGRFESFQEGQQALAQFKKSDLSRSFKDAFIRTLEL